MATKNATATAAVGNGAIGAQGAVDGEPGASGGARPAGAAGGVWDALTGNPGGTVAVIAGAAGVSRATASRTLAALEADGRAARTPGGRDGGKRLPDTWHATAATPTTTTTGGADGGGAGAGEDGIAPTGPVPDASADGPEAASSGPLDTTDSTDTGDADTTGTGDTEGDGEEGMDSAAVAEARDALTALREGITAALAALEAGDGEAAVLAAEGAYSGSGLVRRLVRAAARGPVRTPSGRVRSQPGAMRAKVAAHLTAHPGAEFTPHEVAKVIGHSAGAVSNALDRLAEDGDAELVCERPRRFTTTRRATGAAEATVLAAR
ncbi:MarR family transcriptional regulator [Actinomadura violacea]|uniref:MarR family transcriptional regulator n=1 Tax=Actinomadura violacea TaxID=2819934 RepID=A0ABS3SB08_9ACTN|nr:helix-turn-helix domain-containing protein [Actinomadura violacea]MBO2465385.1 MarR family transcriptional regulator [Actinomadura violacea]